MRAWGVVVLSAVLAVPVAAQQQSEPQSQRPERQVGTAGTTVTVEAITDNPERFYGETVTVAGEIGKVYGKKAFNLKEKGIIDVDDRLVVLTKKAHENLAEDSVVQVRGKVRAFVKSEVERDLGISDWNDYGLDENFFTDNERKPVLIADSVSVTARDRSQRERPRSETQVGTSGAAGAATVEAISDNPERFYDQMVSLSGEVGEVHSKQAFNLQEEGIIDVDDRLLVLSKKPLTGLTEDSTVHVRGKVRAFVKSEIERDLGITDWNVYGLDESFFSSNERKPVLIAESVEVRQARDRK